MTKFYKITNKNETHRGLQYHDGVNVDPLPFNPSGNCDPGGIYFASRDIFAFITYGPWIREVTLPEGEPIYTNPGIPVKYKAHQVVLGPRKEINLDVIKELVADGCDPQADNNYIIRWVAWKGRLDTVKYLVSVGCDPKAGHNLAIRLAYVNKRLDIIDYLKTLGCKLEPSELLNIY